MEDALAHSGYTSEADFAAALRQKCPKAIRAMLECWGGPTYNRAIARGLGHQGGEDALQETMVKVLRNLNKAPNHSKAWFIRVGYNVVEDRARSKGRQVTIPLYAIEEQAVTEPDAGRDERLAALRGAVARLSHNDRHLLVLTYEDNLTAAGAAERLGITADAVYQRLSRIRARLKVVVAGQCETAPHPDG